MLIKSKMWNRSKGVNASTRYIDRVEISTLFRAACCKVLSLQRGSKRATSYPALNTYLSSSIVSKHDALTASSRSTPEFFSGCSNPPQCNSEQFCVTSCVFSYGKPVRARVWFQYVSFGRRSGSGPEVEKLKGWFWCWLFLFWAFWC